MANAGPFCRSVCHEHDPRFRLDPEEKYASQYDPNPPELESRTQDSQSPSPACVLSESKGLTSVLRIAPTSQDHGEGGVIVGKMAGRVFLASYPYTIPAL